MTLLEAQCTSQISEAKKCLRCLLYERHTLKNVLKYTGKMLYAEDNIFVPLNNSLCKINTSVSTC